MWQQNKLVQLTFTSHHSQNGWGYIEGLGWRKVKTGNTDGVTNCFLLLCAAAANNRRVDVFIDAANEIEQALMR
jgi:hypothetical protein